MTQSLGVILVFAFILHAAEGKPRRAEPYPKNIVAFENGKAQMTCAMTDSSEARPDGITFTRTTLSGEITTNLDDSERFSSESSYQDGGKKLIKTLHFIKIVKQDDGRNGINFECIGNSSGVTKKLASIAVFVISENERPTAKVTGALTTVGSTANLSCIVTNPIPQVNVLKEIHWVRNSKIISKTSSGSLNSTIAIKNVAVRDSGAYVCKGIVQFLRTFEMNINFGKAYLKLKLKIAKGITSIEGMVNSSITMECPADGYPYNVSWWRVEKVTRNHKEIGLNQSYIANQSCPFCRHTLTIPRLQQPDQGDYACYANTKSDSGVHFFEISVKDGETSTTQIPTNSNNEALKTSSIQGSPSAHAMMISPQISLCVFTYMLATQMTMIFL